MLDYRVFTFMKVCETMNFTQAAKELHITQPAVTKHIQALEIEYQTKLFTFSGKHCQLTQNGEELLNLLMTINNDIQHFKSDLKKDVKPLNFGATSTIGEFILCDSLIHIFSQYSQYQFNMLVNNTTSLLKALDQGKIDFAIIEGFFSKEKYDFLPYTSESFIAVASSQSDLNGKAVTLETLLDYPIIIREQGSGTREMLSLILKENNLSINDFRQVTEIGSLNMIRSLVAHNVGISFVYRSVVKNELASGKLVAIDLDIPPVCHDFTFIWRKNSHFKTLYQDIFKLFLENKDLIKNQN